MDRAAVCTNDVARAASSPSGMEFRQQRLRAKHGPRWGSTMPILLALFALILASAGCSDDTPDEPVLSSEVQTRLESAIVRERKRFRDIPGRTGILAEEAKYSVFAEELIIRDFFQDRERGFFLDVGCAWPVTGNNTYYLEKHLGWTGIGVDALDDYAAGWEEKRPASKFFNFLVTDETGSDGSFFKSPGLGLSSTNRRMASGKWFGGSMEPTEIKVPMTTLNDLLDHEGIAKIDLVSIDIEGHEAKALAGFDVERFQPELMVVEGRNPKVTKFLAARGYERIQRYIPFDNANRYFQRRKTVEPSGD